MISRVAESCFWLQRYLERADNTARLVSVNRAFVLDVDLGSAEQWWPVVVVVGEHKDIKAKLKAEQQADGEAIQEYLTWSERNPVSIVSSSHWARENARTIREVISLEMWETLNTFWHWLRGGPGRRLYREDAFAFYTRVREHAALFQGTCYNTMMQDQPFYFMQLGMLLERAGWTTRILDVKHHMIESEHVSPVGAAQLMALLRSCSATEPFFKTAHEAPTARRVVGFLLLSRNFPRSVFYCLRRTQELLSQLRPRNGQTGEKSWLMLAALLDDLERLSIEDIFERGLHDELTRLIEAIAQICAAVHDDYFDPPRTLLELAVQQQQHVSD